MLKKYIKTIFIVMTALLLVVFAASCGGNNENSGKIPFAPKSDIYTIYMESGWATLDAAAPNQLFLLNNNLGYTITIDCFEKSNLSIEPEPAVTDFDKYIEYYKGFEIAASIYGVDNENEVGEIEKLNIQNTIIQNGKRQKAFGQIAESMTEGTTAEIIYIETADYYFAFSFGNTNSKFEDSQQVVNNAIKSLSINK